MGQVTGSANARICGTFERVREQFLLALDVGQLPFV